MLCSSSKTLLADAAGVVSCSGCGAFVADESAGGGVCGLALVTGAVASSGAAVSGATLCGASTIWAEDACVALATAGVFSGVAAAPGVVGAAGAGAALSELVLAAPALAGVLADAGFCALLLLSAALMGVFSAVAAVFSACCAAAFLAATMDAMRSSILSVAVVPPVLGCGWAACAAGSSAAGNDVLALLAGCGVSAFGAAVGAGAVASARGCAASREGAPCAAWGVGAGTEARGGVTAAGSSMSTERCSCALYTAWQWPQRTQPCAMRN